MKIKLFLKITTQMSKEDQTFIERFLCRNFVEETLKKNAFTSFLKLFEVWNSDLLG